MTPLRTAAEHVFRRPWVYAGAAFVALAWAMSPTGAQDAPPADAGFDRDVKPFLARHCARCHKDGKAESGVRVDNLTAAFDDAKLKHWEHVRKQIADGTMPPEDATQPTADERKRAAEWVGKALAAARARPAPKNGLTRRLTVAQYRNTLRELLQLDDELADRLPPDAVSKDGFVNNKDTLQLSPLLLEAYFEVAEVALDRCVVDPAAKPTIQTFRVDLGRGVNPAPIPDRLILGADSLLLNNSDWTVTELAPDKGFAYTPFRMRTKYRFIEGYQGNDTVRGWREYDSIYHAVFACMRGTRGYPKGRAYDPVPQGLLLRPAIPSSEIFGAESTYGPRANFRIALRELPDHGRFRVTVTAAKYDDGLLLDPGVMPGAGAVELREAKGTLTVPAAGVYQVDVYGSKAADLTLTLGDRVTITNHTALYNVRAEGDSYYRTIDNATLASTLLNFQYLGIRTITNQTDANVTIRPTMGLFAGYAFSDREIGSVQQTEFGGVPDAQRVTQTNRLNAGTLGIRWRPIKPLMVMATAELGRTDRPIFPTSERNYHALGGRIQYQTRQLRFAAYTKTNYNTNSVSLSSFSSRSRQYAGEASWMPSSRMSFDVSYSKLHLDTRGGIAYFANFDLVTGEQSLYISNIHHGNANVHFTLASRVDLLLGYSRVQDTGDGRRNPFGGSIATSVPALQAAQTFPLAYESPLARISVRLRERLRWNVGYQYYRYREDFSAAQNYRANTGYTSLLWSF